MNIKEKNKGITLIALIITIIVMLILVGVTISMAVNGGLFGYAGKAAKDTEEAKKKEEELAGGKIEIDGLVYNSIDEYLNGGFRITSEIREENGEKYIDLTFSVVGVETGIEYVFKLIDNNYYPDRDEDGLYEIAEEKFGWDPTSEEIENIKNEAAYFEVPYLTYLRNMILNEALNIGDSYAIEADTKIMSALLISVTVSNGDTFESQIGETYSYKVTEKGVYIFNATTGDGKKAEHRVDMGVEKFSAIYTKTQLYTDNEGKTAQIPKGFAVGISEGINKISTGLVITDAVDENGYSIGNEFVWIPVNVTKNDTETSIASFYRSKWEDNARSESLMDSTNYTEPYANGYTGEDTDYNKMLASVYHNGGFYIGRYEAGIKITENAEARTDSTEGTTTDWVIQRNCYPYTYVGWGSSMTSYTGDVTYSSTNRGSGALELCKNFYTEEDKVGVTSTLCYGIMWDAMLDFIKDSSHDVTNSTAWGNYKGNAWTITNTDARWTTSPSSDSTWTPVDSSEKAKTNSVSILLTTGASDSFAAKNIYDVAGNVYEWTNEAYSADYRVIRGGDYNYSREDDPASYRLGDYPDNCDNYIGFRPALYIK